jgi:two-component system, LuxR family, sensor kinase FixL
MPPSFDGISFREFFDMAADAMLIVDSEGRIVLSNHPAQQLLGYSETELNALHVEAIMPQRYRERHARHRSQFFQDQKNRPMDRGFELIALNRDGLELPVNISLCSCKGGGQSYVLVSLHFNDAESRFHQLAENIHGVLWLTTPDKEEMLYISPGYERIWGRSCSSLLASPTSWMESVVPEDREQVIAAAINQQISGDYNVEYRIQKPNGEIRWIHDRAFPVKDKSGKIYRIAGIAEDITDSKKVYGELLKSELRLKESQLIAKLGSWELDFTTNLLTWSDEVFRIFEIDKEHFGATYEAFLEMIHPDDRDAVNEAYTRHLADHIPYEITHRLRMPDGRIKYVFERCKSEYHNGNPLRSIGTIQDITERKRLEKEILDRRNEMAELQKLHIAAQTASAFAHELNQPLLSIASYSEAALMLLNAPKPNLNKIRAAIEGSERQALRAGQSIRQLLDLLSMNEFPTESFDLNREILDALSVAKKEHELEFHSILRLEDGLPLVRANRTHVQKVLLNLLHNGIEAMQQAGVPLPAALTVTVRTKKDDNLAQVTIQDNGPGFKTKDIKRLFEPFFTTKPSGIGMGLSISRSLIEANGGQLWADPQAGLGATFHLTLPFAS